MGGISGEGGLAAGSGGCALGAGGCGVLYWGVMYLGAGGWGVVFFEAVMWTAAALSARNFLIHPLRSKVTPYWREFWSSQETWGREGRDGVTYRGTAHFGLKLKMLKNQNISNLIKINLFFFLLQNTC